MRGMLYFERKLRSSRGGCQKKKISSSYSLTHGMEKLKLKKRMASHVKNLDRENDSL